MNTALRERPCCASCFVVRQQAMLHRASSPITKRATDHVDLFEEVEVTKTIGRGRNARTVFVEPVAVDFRQEVTARARSSMWLPLTADDQICTD
jgi:hypothetical protein